MIYWLIALFTTILWKILSRVLGFDNDSHTTTTTTNTENSDEEVEEFVEESNSSTETDSNSYSDEKDFFDEFF